MSTVLVNAARRGGGENQTVTVIPISGEQGVWAVCRRCGNNFLRKHGENPASAQYFNCERCNNKNTKDMVLVNLTCGASSLCAIQ
ncbi:unnamed protein product [Choristocarpus tenellus]